MDLIRKLTLSRRGLFKLAATTVGAAFSGPGLARLLGAPALAGCGGGGGLGSNKNIDHEVLVSDADYYGGSWTGDWTVTGTGKVGTVTGVVAIDPDARTLKIDLSVDGDVLQDGKPVAAFSVSGEVDSFTYGDDGEFEISRSTPLGAAVCRNGATIGSGKFILRVTSLVGHPDIKSLDFDGVANRNDEIPTNIKVTRADDSVRMGTLTFRKG